MDFLRTHTIVRFDLLALITLIILIAAVVYFIVKKHKRNKLKDDLEMQIKNAGGEVNPQDM